MRFLANAKIGHKIVAAFVLVLCCTAGLGLFAVSSLNGVNTAAAEVRDHWLPSTRNLARINDALKQYRIYESRHIITPSEAGKSARDADLKAARQRFAEAWSDYEPLISAGRERELADAFAREQAQFFRLSEEVLGLSRKNDPRALELFESTELKVYFAAVEVLQTDLNYNVQEGKRAADVGAALGRSANVLILVALALMATVCAAIGWSLVRAISVPVVAMTTAMRRLAEDDLTAEIPGVGRSDEIGAMAGAVQVFKDNALHSRAAEAEQVQMRARRAIEDERVRAETEQAAAALVVGSIGTGLQRLAAGDLTYRLDAELPPAYQALQADLNKATAQLLEALQAIVGSAHGIKSSTGEIAQASDDLSRRTEQQAASLEQTAAALEQITTTVRKTAEGAKHAQTVVSQARSDAEQSGQVVRNAVAAMGEIERSSQQIGQIIGVIDEIAFQTNLLALNAGVEAARAGDAGRGFAVVASEVRALAQRSAEAAKEIKTLISASAQQVGSGVKLVDETGRALARIATQVAEINGVVAEIAHSAQEQATGLNEVNTAVNQMDQVTQQNAAMVEETTAAAHSLATESEELARLAGRFELGREDRAALRPAMAPPRRAAAPPARPARHAASKVVMLNRSPAITQTRMAAEAAAESWEEF